jgi:hypothetical protein
MQEQAMIEAVLRHPMTPEGAKDVINTLLRQREEARSIHRDEIAIMSNAWRVAKLDRDKYYWRAAELHGRLIKLTSQLEQARGIATLLEAECANCWGPIHKDAIDQAQALQRIEEATDVEG